MNVFRQRLLLEHHSTQISLVTLNCFEPTYQSNETCKSLVTSMLTNVPARRGQKRGLKRCLEMTKWLNGKEGRLSRLLELQPRE